MTFFASAITSFEVRPLRVGVNIDVLIAVDGDDLYGICLEADERQTRILGNALPRF